MCLNGVEWATVLAVSPKFALFGAPFGERRIAARHQPLSRIIRTRQTDQVLVVEQVELQRAAFGEPGDGAALQGRDPLHAIQFPRRGTARLRHDASI